MSQSIPLPIPLDSNPVISRKLSRSMQHFGVSASAKSRPSIRRALVILTIFFTFTVLMLTQLRSPAVIPDNNDLMRYSRASAHFRKSLTPEQLEAYYQQREAALRVSVSATTAIPDVNVVAVNHVTTSYFQTCVIAAETSCLHPSLRRGPDAKEINGRASAKQPRDFEDVFSVIDSKRFYFDPDRNAVRKVDDLGAGLDSDLDDAIQVSKAVVERDSTSALTDVTVPIAYLRTTRRDGWQTVVNIAGVVNHTVNGIAKRSNVRRMVTVTRGYGKPCQVSFVRPRQVVRINVLVPYSNRPHRIAAFLNMFNMYFDTVKTDLVRIIVSTTKEEEAAVNDIINEHADLTEARVLVVTSNGDEFGKFSRAVALREAAKEVSSSEIIFISDTDLTIGGNFLQNCRVNVVRGSQVWFPVMFSLYPYGRGLSSKDGMWRRSSYGMACMYQSDFDAVHGFGPNEESAFTGWGSEDVFLYNRFRDDDKYAVFRTLEPGLQHQWHGKDCEHNEHYENCMRTVYMTIGSQDAIAKLMVDAHVDITNLTKNALPV